MLDFLGPGSYVRHPKKPEWGIGQVQSVIGERVTVNFEHAGKRLIISTKVDLEAIDPSNPQHGEEMTNLTTLTETLCEIAQKASIVIMEIYAGDFEVDTKDDRSPVTEADKQAEIVILAELAKAFPDIPVISEEAFSEGNRPEIGDMFFLVDPVDGTKEFISKNGEFTVNIALIDKGHPVAGVVLAPAKERLFAGNRDDGAFQATSTAARQPIKVNDAQNGGLVAVASRSHRDSKTDEYLAHYNIKDIVAAGSSLKFCLVATGEADIYPRHGRTMEWDTAAGHAVLAAAGGKVTKLDGSPFLYGKTQDGFANPFFVAKGNVD
jgi:3'(2'), 5'-bisphosphate nucleotidase